MHNELVRVKLEKKRESIRVGGNIGPSNWIVANLIETAFQLILCHGQD